MPKKIIGYGMLALFFIVIFAAISIMLSIKVAVIVFIIAIVSVIWIMVASYLTF